jgi:hypothetical protein
MKAIVLGLAISLTASLVQAQRAPDAETTQKMRELACREQAARDMQKSVQLPPGTTRAWEFEQGQREKLCLIKAAKADEAQLLSHRHYQAKDGHEVHSPARSTHDQVPVGASAKCRDGTYSFSQHRRGNVFTS